MTRERDFKRLVRARMRRTGESYVTARARLRRRGLPPPPAPGGDTGMYPFDRFTERAKKVLTLAQAEAERSGVGYIGTEHLLLGLVAEGGGLAARTLAALGVEEEAVRRRLESVTRPEPGVDVAERPVVPTARTKKTVELAFGVAEEMGHRYVGTEHLLLGLLREGEGVAAKILGELGVSEEAVRTGLEPLLADAEAAAPSRRPLEPSADLMSAFDVARDLAALEEATAIGADHLLVALAEPGSPIAAMVGSGVARAAAALVPGLRAIREAQRVKQDAVERADYDAAARQRDEMHRLRDELRPAVREWRQGRGG